MENYIICYDSIPKFINWGNQDFCQYATDSIHYTPSLSDAQYDAIVSIQLGFLNLGVLFILISIVFLMVFFSPMTSMNNTGRIVNNKNKHKL